MSNKKDVYELIESKVDDKRGIVWEHVVKVNGGAVLYLAVDEFNKLESNHTVEKKNRKIVEQPYVDEYSLKNKYSDHKGGFGITTGNNLLNFCEETLKDIKGSRDCLEDLYNQVIDKKDTRIVLVNGVRRIGKSIMIVQCIRRMIDEGRCTENDIAYVTVNEEMLDSYDLYQMMDELLMEDTKRYKYVFIDEISRIKRLNSHGQYLHDRFYMNTKLILTGTHSYTFPVLYTDELSTRSCIINVHPLSYREHIKLIEPCTVMEFMRCGGIFTKDFLASDGTAKYIWDAITKNISTSIAKNGVDMEYYLKDSDIVRINAMINRVIYNSLDEIKAKLFTKGFNPKYDLRELGKSNAAIKESISKELEKNMPILGTIDKEDSEKVVESMTTALMKIGVIGAVFHRDDTSKVAYHYTRFIGLLYSICNEIAKPELLEKVFPHVSDRELIRSVSESYRKDIEGTVMETLIVTEIESKFNPFFSTRKRVSMYKLRYGNKVEVDIVLRDAWLEYPKMFIDDMKYIEVKRGKCYRPPYIRWLVDKSISADEKDSRIVVYNGPTFKMNPRNDAELMSLKDSDALKVTSRKGLDSIPMGFDERCDYVYLVNVADFLSDIESYLDVKFLRNLPEYIPSQEGLVEIEDCDDYEDEEMGNLEFN